MSTCSKCSSPVLAKGLCKKHYRAQPERAAVERAKHKEWLAKNKDYHNEQQAEYRREYHASHRDDAAVRSSEWRKKHPGAHKEEKRTWRIANPEAVKASVTNRRARLRNAVGQHTASEIKDLFTKQRGCCAICRKQLSKSYHKDHVMPLALGGSNDILNIQLLCQPCNSAKSFKHPIDFMQSRGMLL